VTDPQRKDTGLQVCGNAVPTVSDPFDVVVDQYNHWFAETAVTDEIGSERIHHRTLDRVGEQRREHLTQR